MNYKICCYSDRKNSKNENKVVDKYQLGPAVNNKYTKILEDAKSYLKKSASKPKKLFWYYFLTLSTILTVLLN